MSYRTNYCELRWRHIPHVDGVATFADVMRFLGINRWRLREWLKRSDFREAKLAFSKKHGKRVRWYVNLDRLHVWLVYIGAIKPRQKKASEIITSPTMERTKKKNPPDGSQYEFKIEHYRTMTKSEYARMVREKAKKELLG